MTSDTPVPPEAIAAIVGIFAIRRCEATMRWCGSLMSVESW